MECGGVRIVLSFEHARLCERRAGAETLNRHPHTLSWMPDTFMKIPKLKVFSSVSCPVGLIVVFSAWACHRGSPDSSTNASESIAHSISQAEEKKRGSAPQSGEDASVIEVQTDDGLTEFRTALQNVNAAGRKQDLRRVGFLLASKDAGLAQKSFVELIRGDDKETDRQPLLNRNRAQ